MRGHFYIIAFCGLVAGCSTVGRIKTKLATVTAVKDAGKPARLDSEVSGASLPIPAGSRLVMTKIEATPAIPATERTDEVPAQPAKEVTEVVLSRDSEWRRNETRVRADTGTVDVSIRKHQIDVASAKPLLFAAIGAAFAAGVFMYLKYPTPALMCGAAAIVFFLAWKLSDLPSWFYVIGVGGIVGAVALHRGYERREKEEKERAEELAKAKAIAVVVPTEPKP